MKPVEELNTNYMDILILILRGCNTSTRLAKKLKINRKTASNRLIHLCKKGYIDKNIIMNARPYELTKKGHEATAKILSTLKGRSKIKNTPLKAHKVSIYCDIVKKPWDLVDQLDKNAFMVTRHKSWNKYRKQINDIKIVFNPKKVYFYVNGFYLNNPMEYYPLVIKKVEEAKADLQKRFPGLTLGEPNKQMVVASNHIVKQYGPLAMKFFKESIKLGKPIVYHGDKLNVDFSDGPPEEETVDPKTAPADMHALGEYYNDWLKNPIQVADQHAAIEATHQIKSDQSELQASVEGELGEIKGVLKQIVEHEKVFGEGMQQHMTLIKALQDVAYDTRDGLSNLGNGLKNGLANLGVEIRGGINDQMEEMKEAQEERSKIYRKNDRALKTELQKLQDELHQLKKPWYKKIWQKINRGRYK